MSRYDQASGGVSSGRIGQLDLPRGMVCVVHTDSANISKDRFDHHSTRRSVRLAVTST